MSDVEGLKETENCELQRGVRLIGDEMMTYGDRRCAIFYFRYDIVVYVST